MGFVEWIYFAFLMAFVGVIADVPCAVRQIKDKSVVCVCTNDYCDRVQRVAPSSGQYVAYTSSKNGSRFKVTTGKLELYDESEGPITLDLDPEHQYQTVEGFGGAVTDAAGINWRNLSDALQQQFIDAYYSEDGLEYNMLRVPIGGTDFSTHPYAYNELPLNDAALTNFSLSEEDYRYKIPMIKSILETSKTPVHIVATTWSPPIWMKTNKKYTGRSRLRPEYFQTYADYHYKFIEEYDKEGIQIWAITTTNEPLNAYLIPLSSFNTLGWSVDKMGEWIANNLGPTIRGSKYKDVKILAVDDQRITLPLWLEWMVRATPEALNVIDGVAVHYYTDFIVPPTLLRRISKKFPDKFIISTEACEGSRPWQYEKVSLGDWGRAENYISDILTDLNYKLVGWIDWNLCLNAQGGPNWVKNFVDSSIIVFPERGEFVKQPMYYALGHFSKFIPRGSKRIDVQQKKSFFESGIDNVAFLTPRDTISVVLYNKYKRPRNASINMGDNQALLELEANSITTVEFNYNKK